MATDTVTDRGFLLAEEEALKAKLSNIYVTDPNATSGHRRVHTRWGYPAAEVNRQYPFLTIDLIDIEFAADRAHSAQIVPIDYWPSEYATFAEYATAYGLDYTEDQLPEATMWHPYNLHFQIASHTRNARHDREISSILLGTAFTPHRWGWLYVPADESHRWLDLVDWATANYNEGGAGASTNRIFRKIYHIVVSAHLPPELPFIFEQVLKVHGSVTDILGNEEMGTWDHEAPAP